MEKGTIKGVLIGIAALIIVMIVSYLIGRNDGRIKAESAIVEKVDTLLVFDTIMQYKPIYEERTIVKKELVPVPVTDTLWKTDTMYVYLEREQVVWQDSLSRIYASGILPQVDSVQHFIQDADNFIQEYIHCVTGDLLITIGLDVRIDQCTNFT